MKCVKAQPPHDVKRGMRAMLSPVFDRSTDIMYNEIGEDEGYNYITWSPEKEFKGTREITDIEDNLFVEIDHGWYYPRQALLVKAIDYD